MEKVKQERVEAFMEWSQALREMMIENWVIVLSCIGVCIILLLVSIKCAEGKMRVVGVTAAIFGMLVMVCMLPIGATEHTDVVTIEGMSDDFWAIHKANFSVDGETYSIDVDEGHELVYQILEGQEIELTYAKIHSLWGSPNYYELTGIKLVDSDSASEELQAAIMSLQKN